MKNERDMEGMSGKDVPFFFNVWWSDKRQGLYNIKAGKLGTIQQSYNTQLLPIVHESCVPNG